MRRRNCADGRATVDLPAPPFSLPNARRHACRGLLIECNNPAPKNAWRRIRSAPARRTRRRTARKPRQRDQPRRLLDASPSAGSAIASGPSSPRRHMPAISACPPSVAWRTCAARSGPGAGRRDCVALVPTMGFLHAGHLSLVRLGKARAGRVVASLFVNPDPVRPERGDFEAYPRGEARDAAHLALGRLRSALRPDAWLRCTRTASPRRVTVARRLRSRWAAVRRVRPISPGSPPWSPSC